jgi:hypothetical protein
LGSHPKQDSQDDTARPNQRSSRSSGSSSSSSSSTSSSSSSSSSTVDAEELMQDVLYNEGLLEGPEAGMTFDLPSDRSLLGSSWRWAERSIAAAKIAAAKARKATQLSSKRRRKGLREAQRNYRCGEESTVCWKMFGVTQCISLICHV